MRLQRLDEHGDLAVRPLMPERRPPKLAVSKVVTEADHASIERDLAGAYAAEDERALAENNVRHVPMGHHLDVIDAMLSGATRNIHDVRLGLTAMLETADTVRFEARIAELLKESAEMVRVLGYLSVKTEKGDARRG